MKYLPFVEARKYVRTLGLKSQSQWREYCKTDRKRFDLPSSPSTSYKNEWKGWGDWLGTGRVADQYKAYKKFEDARNYTRAQNIRSSKAWRNYIKAGKKPADIPSAPWRTYKENWTGWGDWLGTGIIASFNKKFRTYTSSRAFVRGLRIKSIAEWRKYAKSGKKPIDIPSNPDSYYTTEWKDWGEFLGTGFVAFKDRKYQDFEKARKFTHQLAFRSREDWTKYAMSKSRPQNIPADPSKIYKDNWKGWGNWLGTGTLAPKNKKFLSFMDARIVVQSQHLGSIAKWSEYIKQGSKPYNIPSNPDNYYKNEWKSWGDWLGTGTIAVKDRVYLSFQEAKEFVHKLNLTSQPAWFQYAKTNKKPDNIPANPPSAYNSEWISWPDWLGYEEKLWSIKKVKELLRDLIESNIIYGWDEAVLYSLLLRKGLLNLSSGTRHKEFFKNFVEAVKTVEGRKSINEYAYSDSENIPDLFGIKERMKTKEGTDEIQLATSEDLASLPNSDPLEYGTHHAVEQILHNTLVLESINIDEEAIQFYLSYSVGELWKLAFQNEQKTVNEIRLSKKYENKYSKAVVESFLATYYGIKEIKLPTRYSFPYPPTLMQLYVAYKVKSLPYFGNFSATGAGKTLSAIVSSRILESKMTVIVCPNDVVDQWRRNILEVFPDSQVITGKESFFTTYTKKDYKYLVLNYDKFSQEESPNLILNLAKQKINFVVLDEIHFTKIRDEDEISKRRKNLDGLMTLVRKKNPNVKVLGLSATPVVNNLREGKSLLELITGKIYDDVATKPTIPNAVTLYEKLSTLSIRELPKYSVDLDTQVIDVVAQRPPSITVRYLKTNPLSIEKILTDARIPEIVKQIEGQCIIYTEYVEDIVKKISKAVENAGFTFALYTGSDRSGLTKFLDKKVQVLIASRPLSVGVDGLQHICNRLIINTLPWTNAQYQQLLGRLVRKGQIRDVVHVYLIKASIGGYQYDELKWKRIQFKRTLADCAVDGVLPERNLVTPQQAAMEAVKWLERLERGEISTVLRKDLNVELAPVEIKKRIAKFGDFTKLNNRINNENSKTTHHRMLKDPTEWEEYHRQYRESRKTWAIVPYEEIAKRVKQLSPRLMIGDFGCGEAKILEEFGDKRVYSFDHVAINDNVTACDMKTVPLPDEAIDIAIFSLSLMGRNWSDYIAEAKRCLATNGYLLIAETTKSVKGRMSNIRDIIKKQGFDIYSDEQKGDFTFIEAREL